MNRHLKTGLVTLRKGLLCAAVVGVAALGGGFVGRQAEGTVAVWCMGPKRAGPPRLEPVSVAFVVEATPDAAPEIAGLAAGITGFRDELARSGGDARLALVVAGGDAVPRAASFDGGPFTADAAAFRGQLVESKAAAADRPRVSAAIEAAAAALKSAEGRRCLVVVGRDVSAADFSAAVPVLQGAGVSGVSLAVAKAAAAAVEPVRRGFSGAVVPLGDDDSTRRNFELAVPGLAAGLVKPVGSWLPNLATMVAIAPAAVGGACLAALTAIGLLAARRWLGDVCIGTMQWIGLPAAAAVLGAMLAAAGTVARPIVPYAQPLVATVLGGGIAWLASGSRTGRQAGLASGLAAAATGVTTALIAWLLPAMPWPAVALALGAPLGATLGSVARRPALKIRLPGGRVRDVHVGLTLTATDLPGLTAAAGRAAVAEVVANPTRPGVIGLRNLSQQTWTLVTPEGRKAAVAPTKSAEIRTGTRIDFGRVRGEFA